MDTTERYRLSRHESGEWNVIDNTTGGPAEVALNGSFRMLYKLEKTEAEAWLLLLTPSNKTMN